MANKERMAIALFCPRRNVVPTFAAILPQLEERGPDGQMEPPGMYIIPLPYADDIREAPERHKDQLQGEGWGIYIHIYIVREVSFDAISTVSKANEDQIECAGKIVKAFTKNSAFNPDFFPNAGLNHHYQVLLAVAFNDEMPTDVEDKTVPNYPLIKKVRLSYNVEILHNLCWLDRFFHRQRAGPLIAEWNELSAEDDRRVGSMTVTSDKKRPADFANDDEPELKRLHLDGNINKVREHTWSRKRESNLSLSFFCLKLVTEKLKAACNYYRLPKTGKKADLVDRLEEHLNRLIRKDEKWKRKKNHLYY